MFEALRKDRGQRKVRGWREHHPYGDFDPDPDCDCYFEPRRGYPGEARERSRGYGYAAMPHNARGWREHHPYEM